MSGSQSRKRRRLHKNDPHCHWCGRETVIGPVSEQWMADNIATVDHVISRPEWKRRRLAGETLPADRNEVVLACYGCNQRRNREDNARLADAIASITVAP